MKKKIVGVVGFLCVIGCVLVIIAQFRSYEYSEVYQHISEPYGSGFFYQGIVNQVYVNNHTYEFDKTISEEKRTTFVEQQEKLCKILEKNDLSTTGLTFRIFDDYLNRTESEEGLAYYGIDTLKTWEQVLTTIQVCMGDYTNYGYLYALSNRIAEELRWSCDDAIVENEMVFMNDSGFLNLVYPCFAEKYSDTADIGACKALAIKLLSTTKDIWSEEEFLRTRASYAQDKNINFEPTYVMFAYNGESCPLKLSCKYMEVFWDASFVACKEYLDGDIPKDYVDGVSGLIHTFEWLDEQLTMYCEKFEVVPDQPISVQMMDRLPPSSFGHKDGGLYYNENGQGKAYATTVTVLAHEYMHHIYWLLCGCTDPDYEGWQNEVVAYYYTLGHRYEYRVNIISYVDPSYRERLEAMIGEAYDEPLDYIKFVRIGWRETGNDYIYYLKNKHELCSAFGEYFVRIYGEDIFLKSMMCPSRVEEFTGFSMDEIVDDWVVDMCNPEND